MVWIHRHLYSCPFFFERITPRGPDWCTLTSASYENILMQRVIPALQERSLTVLRPLFLCRGTTAYQSPSSTSASWNHRWTHYLQTEVFQILGLQDLLTWIHVTSDWGDTWSIVSTKDMFDLWLIWRREYSDMLLRFHENFCEQQLITPFYGCNM